jgi:hypothetical protein
MYANYTGALYRVLRDSDKAALDIPMGPAGFPRTDQQDTFCNQTECYVVRIYDQSPMRNHLDTSPPGECCHFPLKPVNAKRDPISIAGTERTVYGAYFEGNMGYRNDVTSGVATGEMEQTMYMVTRGDHVNGGCCFDYGNAETDNDDDGEGTMEAIYFGTSTGWGHGQGDGPWVMADLENGLWAGDVKDAPAPSITFKYVTAMAKGKKGGFALKGGNAQEGQLQTLHEGKRPTGYATMKKQGAIILGIGGDNSCSAVGTFYEGAMTASYTSDATDDAVQANIVAVGTARRLAKLPEVPTFAESGIEGLPSPWWGYGAPAGTPPARRARTAGRWDRSASPSRWRTACGKRPRGWRGWRRAAPAPRTSCPWIRSQENAR